VCLSSKFEELHQDHRRRVDISIENIIKNGTDEEINTIINSIVKGLNNLKGLLRGQ
jgi:hypothetical protein